MGHRTLSSTTFNPTNDAIITSRDDREQPSLAIGAHAGVGYGLSKHWGLEVGVGYQQLGWQYTVNLSDLTFGDMIEPRRGFIYRSDDVAFTRIMLTDRFHYFDLPVGFTFKTGKGTWRSITELGVAPAVLIAVKDGSKREYADGHVEKEVRDATDAFNTFNVFPYLSTGVAFRAWERWELRLQPTVRYGALRIIDTPVTANLYMGSFDVGVHFLP